MIMIVFSVSFELSKLKIVLGIASCLEPVSEMQGVLGLFPLIVAGWLAVWLSTVTERGLLMCRYVQLYLQTPKQEISLEGIYKIA